MTAGLDALVARKPAEARRIAAELEKAHSNEMMMLEGAPELLRAWAAFIEGNSSQVIQKAEPIANAREFGSAFSIRKPAARWLVARSFERMGVADSVRYYDSMGMRGLEMEEIACARLIPPAARFVQAGNE